jgi:hypothetical protein
MFQQFDISSINSPTMFYSFTSSLIVTSKSCCALTKGQKQKKISSCSMITLSCVPTFFSVRPFCHTRYLGIIKMKCCSLLENGWTDLANSFFFNVRNTPTKVFMKKKIGKVARKIEKFGKN